METFKVLTNIQMQGKDVNNAPFWKECWHKDEVTDSMLENGKQWFEYHVKFDGVTPVQITKIKKHRKIENG